MGFRGPLRVPLKGSIGVSGLGARGSSLGWDRGLAVESVWLLCSHDPCLSEVGSSRGLKRMHPYTINGPKTFS